jgi:hypothetical protein
MDEFEGWTNAKHSESYSILLRSYSGKAKMTFDTREEYLFLLIPRALFGANCKGFEALKGCWIYTTGVLAIWNDT